MIYVTDYFTRNSVYVKIFFNKDTNNFELYKGDEVNTNDIEQNMSIIYECTEDKRLLNILKDMKYSSEQGDMFSKALAIAKNRYNVQCIRKREAGDMYYTPMEKETFLSAVRSALLTCLLIRYDKIIQSQNKFISDEHDMYDRVKGFTRMFMAVTTSSTDSELISLIDIGEGIINDLMVKLLSGKDCQASADNSLVLFKQSPSRCVIKRVTREFESLDTSIAVQVVYSFEVDGGYEEFKEEVSLHKKDVCADAVDFVRKNCKQWYNATGDSLFNVQRKYLNAQRIKVNKVHKTMTVTIAFK